MQAAGADPLGIGGDPLAAFFANLGYLGPAFDRFQPIRRNVGARLGGQSPFELALQPGHAAAMAVGVAHLSGERFATKYIEPIDAQPLDDLRLADSLNLDRLRLSRGRPPARRRIRGRTVKNQQFLIGQQRVMLPVLIGRIQIEFRPRHDLPALKLAIEPSAQRNRQRRRVGRTSGRNSSHRRGR